MISSILHFFFTYGFVPNLLLCFYVLYLIALKKKHRTLYAFALIGLTFLIKLQNFFLDDSYNSDEPYWIAGVRLLADNFNPYITCNPLSSGIGALIPLYLFNAIIHLNFFTIRVLETIMDLVTLFFSYKMLSNRLKNNRALLFLGMVILFCFLNLSFDKTFYTYNTEHFCILIFAFVVYIFNKSLILDKGNHEQMEGGKLSNYIAIAGLLLGFSLFIKPQNIPVMFLLFIFYEVFIIYRKQFKYAASLVIYCLLPVIVALLYFWYNGSIYDFYEEYIVTNISYTGIGYINANLHKNMGIDFLSICHYSAPIFKSVFLIICLSIAFIFAANVGKLKGSTKKDILYLLQRPLFFLWVFRFPVLFLGVFVLTIYEIVLPKNYFHHYYILLYQPLLILLMSMRWFEVRKWLIALILIIYTVTLCHKNYAYSSRNNSDDPKYFKNISRVRVEFKKEVSQLDSVVNENNCNKKYILVWGTDLRMFVYGRYLSVNRNIENWTLLGYSGNLKDYYIKCFISDLKANVVNNKFALLQYDKTEMIQNSISFADFVQKNGLSSYFKSIKQVGAHSGYSFYVVELNSGK